MRTDTPAVPLLGTMTSKPRMAQRGAAAPSQATGSGMVIGVQPGVPPSLQATIHTASKTATWAGLMAAFKASPRPFRGIAARGGSAWREGAHPFRYTCASGARGVVDRVPRAPARTMPETPTTLGKLRAKSGRRTQSRAAGRGSTAPSSGCGESGLTLCRRRRAAPAAGGILRLDPQPLPPYGLMSCCRPSMLASFTKVLVPRARICT